MATLNCQMYKNSKPLGDILDTWENCKSMNIFGLLSEIFYDIFLLNFP